MAHYSNPFARAIDFNNREGFEGLMHYFRYPKGTWDYYQEKYNFNNGFENAQLAGLAERKDKLEPHEKQVYRDLRIKKAARWTWAALNYVGKGLARLALLPLTAFVYTLSRVGLVVLNPFAWANNPRKAFGMTVATVVSAGVAAALYLSTNLNVMASAPVLGSALKMFGVSAGVAGVAVTGFWVVVATAFALYGAKLLAQRYNERAHTANGTRREYRGITAPKHFIAALNTPEHALLQPIQTRHADILNSHMKMKASLVNGNVRDNPASMGGKLAGDNPHLPQMKAGIEHGKQALAGLEAVVKKHVAKKLNQADWDEVSGVAEHTENTALSLWESTFRADSKPLSLASEGFSYEKNLRQLVKSRF